jgi:hypothetical protein
MGELFSWVIWHGSTKQEKVEMQQELLRLAKQLAALLLREERGFPAWCKAAASVLGFQAGLPADYVDSSFAYTVQEATAQQLFWLLFVIVANNRPSTAAMHGSGGSGRPPLPVQIQDCFLDTLASLASPSRPPAGSRSSSSSSGGGGGGSNNTAFCLLPERLRLCILKLLAKAGARSSSSSQHSRSGQNSRFHGLQFDEVAAELLATAAASCSLPWAVLYSSQTGSNVPHWARKLKTVMVDEAAAAVQGSSGSQGASSLFSFEQLLHTSEIAGLGIKELMLGSAPNAASHAADGLAATAAVSKGPAAAPAGDEEQQQGLRSNALGRQRPRAAEAEQDDGEDDAAVAAHGKLDDGDDAEATLAGAGLLQTWVHWRLRCWKARAVAKLGRQLSPLQKLQLEAKAVSSSEGAVAGTTGGSSSSSIAGNAGRLLTSAGAAADEYLQVYLAAVCPVMVSMFVMP